MINDKETMEERLEQTLSLLLNVEPISFLDEACTIPVPHKASVHMIKLTIERLIHSEIARERQRIVEMIEALQPPDNLGGTDDEWLSGKWAAINIINQLGR